MTMTKLPRGDDGALATAFVTIEQNAQENGVALSPNSAKRPRSSEPISAQRVPLDHASFLSQEGRARQYPALRVIVSGCAGKEGLIPMHGGLPPPESFAFETLSFTLKDGTRVDITDPAKVIAAQQYSTVPRGYQPLQEWAKRHVEHLHKPPADYDVVITNGNNHCIEMLTSLLLERGDGILCEEFTYPHICDAIMGAKGYTPVPIKMDEQGLLATDLAQVLSRMRNNGQKTPKLLYTTPVGQNPTGAVTPLARKQEIYRVCQQYNILILEDDPYYYLQFDIGGEPRGLQGLGASYLSIDTDARVVRLDSFSKFLGPGMRIGWATAHPTLLQKLIFCLHAGTLGPNSICQVLVSELLLEWGPAGLEHQVAKMQAEYARRASVTHAAAEEHLAGLAEWRVPHAGMFLWVRLLVVEDADEVMQQFLDASVAVVPGRIAHCHGPRPPFPCPFIRISFSNASDEQLRAGMAAMGRVLRAKQAEKVAAACSPGMA